MHCPPIQIILTNSLLHGSIGDQQAHVAMLTELIKTVLAPESWSSQTYYRSKLVHCLYVSWLETLTKLKWYEKCLNITLLITHFNCHFMINNQFRTNWNFDLSLKLFHNPEARCLRKRKEFWVFFYKQGLSDFT